MTGRHLLSGLAALVLLTGACSQRVQPAGPQGSLPWEPCGGGFDCADLSVPLDHADPAGEHIDLALIRRPAGEPGARLGSLVVNPGGPGASGVEFVSLDAETYFSRDVLAQFDIVGFDPRGVGGSAPVDCGFEEASEEADDIPFPPETDQDRQELVASLERLAAECERRSGDLLPHLSTEAAARDLDLLRAGLGEETLSYHGISYGTFLGATYASLFPTRIRAMVLDGAVDPEVWQGDGSQMVRDQTAAFDQALSAFFAACRRNRDTCSFGDGDPAAALDRLVVELADEPSGGSRPADDGAVIQTVVSALYNDASWPELAEALRRAENGDVSLLRTLANGPVHQPPGDRDYNFAAANIAIVCADRTSTPDIQTLERLAEELEEVNPHFGPGIAYGELTCTDWPPVASRYTGPYRADGAPPILVLGTTGDPATPVAHARALAAQLSSGVLLVREGQAHGAYGYANDCVDTAVDAYLLALTVPEDGTTCQE